MIISIFLAVAVIIAIVLTVASMRPDDFRIARSISIAAPTPAAFEQVNDLHRWQEMSPYAKLDPTANYTFAGPPAGTGASLAWSGTSKVGEGRMTITESRPHELVRMELKFLKPFRATNTVEFTFEEEGDQTKATWSMFGQNKFMCKAMGVFMNMDKMCGSQFEEGLANMKAIAEVQARNQEPVPLAVASASGR